MEAAGKKRPATFADIRKLLEDKSIDAVSLATPNFHHTLQTIWAVQAGKDVFVEKPCSYNMFEAQQIIAASRKYNRIVQDGTGAQAWLHEAKQRLKDRHHRRRLHGARPLLQVARHHRSRQGRTGTGRRRLRPVDGSGAREAVHAQPFPLQLALAVGLRQRRYRQPGRPSIARGAHGARREVPYEDQLDGRAFHVRRRPGNAQHAGRHIRVRGGRQEEATGLRGAPLDHQQRGGHW